MKNGAKKKKKKKTLMMIMHNNNYIKQDVFVSFFEYYLCVIVLFESVCSHSFILSGFRTFILSC